MPIFKNRAFVIALFCVPMFWGGWHYSAADELGPKPETIVMTRAELEKHDAKVRIAASREAFSAKECTWRQFLTEQPKKKS